MQDRVLKLRIQPGCMRMRASLSGENQNFENLILLILDPPPPHRRLSDAHDCPPWTAERGRWSGGPAWRGCAPAGPPAAAGGSCWSPWTSARCCWSGGSRGSWSCCRCRSRSCCCGTRSRGQGARWWACGGAWGPGCPYPCEKVSKVRGGGALCMDGSLGEEVV